MQLRGERLGCWWDMAPVDALQGIFRERALEWKPELPRMTYKETKEERAARIAKCGPVRVIMRDGVLI